MHCPSAQHGGGDGRLIGGAAKTSAHSPRPTMTPVATVRVSVTSTPLDSPTRERRPALNAQLSTLPNYNEPKPNRLIPFAMFVVSETKPTMRSIGWMYLFTMVVKC
jgi:hypothetical protein